MSARGWEFTGFRRRGSRLLAGFVRDGEQRLDPVDGEWTVPTCEVEEPPSDPRDREDLLRTARGLVALARTWRLALKPPLERRPARRSAAR